MVDYWTGEELAIDDKICLATSRPKFGGLWRWFVCPRVTRRLRKLYLPLAGVTSGRAAPIVLSMLRSAARRWTARTVRKRR
jgi:hypothetical protein